jgi:FAD/FMN-containing dehydrogenase
VRKLTIAAATKRRHADAMKTVSGLASFQGTLIHPDDDGYDEARRLWNDAIDRRPALIARCVDADDAAVALAYARDAGLAIAVRGGGHNVSGSALVDDGVVIDLSAMKRVEVDPVRRLARVQPGVRWGEVDAATQVHGLATPAGIVSDTGVAGLTVGGGFGWLSRRWGLTSDNLASAEMLLADGNRVRASDDENPDLFWAVQGGGGNFGIVTEFEFRLHDLGTEVLAGPLLYRADQAREVFHAYREFVADAPNEVSVYAQLRIAPTFDWVPPELRETKVLVLIACYSGDLDEGERVLAPLLRAIEPAANLVRRKPYVAHQSMFDPGVPPGWGYYWKSHYLPPLTDDAVDVLVRFGWQMSSPTAFSLAFHLGGAIAERPADFSAAGGRDAAHALNINASWAEGGPEHRDIAWCREYAAAMQPHATGGVYVNFLHNDEGEARVRAAYGSHYDRLAEIKATFDPDNVFHSNQNIKPAAGPPDRT